MMRDCGQCGEPAWVAASLPSWRGVLCTTHRRAAATATAAAATAVAARLATVDVEADEGTTLDKLAAVRGRPPSPTVKIEPAEQMGTWARLGDVGLDRDGSDGEWMLCAVLGAAAVCVAVHGACVRGPGIPKTCRRCGVPKKGHVCPL